MLRPGRACLLPLFALLLAGCPKTFTESLSSDDAATPAQRAQALCTWLICPSRPQDAVFTVKDVEATGALGGDARELRAVFRVSTDETAQWSRNCPRVRLEARPAWVLALAQGHDGFTPTAAPDTFRCAPGDERWVHVRDTLVAVRLRLPER